MRAHRRQVPEGLSAARVAGAALLAIFVTTTTATARADFPLQAGELVATSQPLAPLTFVVTVVDVRDPGCDPGAALGQNWLAPLYRNEMPNPTANPADEWTVANLGPVFGVTLDDDQPPSIYVTASSIWGGQTGRVFRLDGSTGAISVFSDLPNTGPALGNIAYDRRHQQFFVTNHEDGQIYRLDRAGQVLSTFDPFLPDDATPGFAPLGERLWAVGVHENRVYFSVWVENSGRPDPTAVNTVWSVALDPSSGEFAAGDLSLEIEMPPYQATGDWSNPVADLAFADNDWLVVAERGMNHDMVNSPHQARVLEFSGGHLGWSPSARTFAAGQGVQGTNATGGLDFDCPVSDACNSGRRLWIMADAIILQAGNYIYGLQGLPETGGQVADSYLVDLDADLSSTNAKTRLGCLEIYRPVCTLVADAGPPSEFCGTAPSVILDASATSVMDCGAATEYRWLRGSTVLQDWSTLPTVVVTPAATTTYRLEARCGRCACFGAATVTVTVWADVVPPSAGNTLLGVRAGQDLELSWAAPAQAASHVLYRGTLKGSWPATPFRSALATAFVRLNDVPGPPLLYFYRVAGASCSGREGP